MDVCVDVPYNAVSAVKKVAPMVASKKVRHSWGDMKSAMSPIADDDC